MWRPNPSRKKLRLYRNKLIRETLLKLGDDMKNKKVKLKRLIFRNSIASISSGLKKLKNLKTMLVRWNRSLLPGMRNRL